MRETQFCENLAVYFSLFPVESHMTVLDLSLLTIHTGADFC